MKKRAFLFPALGLCAVLLLSLLTRPAAAQKLSFVSVNDTLPPELINSTATYGGYTYVPYYVFSGYGLEIGYTYFSSASTAHLYSGGQQLFFDLVNGGCVDAEDNPYSASAIFYGGTVYVPLSFTAGFFGVAVSYIPGNDYGSILRLTNGTQVLDDAEFLSAAARMMQDYAQRYAPAVPTETAKPDPTPVPTATPAPTPTPRASHTEDRILLCFRGLPDPEALTLLDNMELRGTVFLRAEDLRARADDVRRLVCGGWSLGLLCEAEGAADYDALSALLYDAARVRSVLVSAPPENAEACRADAAARGLVFAAADTDIDDGPAAVIDTLSRGGDHILRLDGSAAERDMLELILVYLQVERFDVGLLRETGAA